MPIVYRNRSTRGNYVMITPVVKVFWKHKSFGGPAYFTVHIGWIVWLFHIRVYEGS